MADYSEGPPFPQAPYESTEYTAGTSGRRMDPGTLKALLDASKVAALAAMQTSKLSLERDDALLYYVGDMSKDMPTIDGRSEAVSTDVQDTVEGLMPQMMEIFCGSEETVKFNPENEQDVEAATQETEYVNHVLMNENPGFLIFYSMIKDALLSKVGVVKFWWEEEEQEVRETYQDLTDDEFAQIVKDEEVEIIKHTEKPADPWTENALEQPGAGPQSAPAGAAPGQSPQSGPPANTGMMLHDVEVLQRKTVGKAKVAPVAPEEFGIEKTARTLRQGFVGGCNYCFHRVIRSQDELIQEGYDANQIRSLPTYMAVTNVEEINRDTVAEHQNVGEEMNPAGRRIEVVEHYVRMDYEGDGLARLYKVTTGSEQGQLLYRNGELDIEEFDDMPFAAMTPIIVTHRFFGRSLADLTMDIQRQKTAIMRQWLDNAYLKNNQQVLVNENMASDSTLDDLLIKRPGGIVRAKGPDAVIWQEVPDIGTSVIPMIEYIDSVREVRTGVQRQGQAINADALQNQSATAVNQMFSIAQAKSRLIARIFAETGIKDLFIGLHGLIRKHGQQAQTVRLRGKWVNIDPRDWKERNHMTVEVGLGTGGKAEQLAFVNQIAMFQEKALAGGLTNLVTPANLYNTAKLLTSVAGHKDVDAFFTNPATQPPPNPPPNPEMIKAQVEQQKMQGQQQLAQQKMQSDVALEQARFQADSQLEQQKFEHQKQLDLLEMHHKTQEHEQKMQLEQHKVHTQAQLQAQQQQHEFGMNAQKQAFDQDMARTQRSDDEVKNKSADESNKRQLDAHKAMLDGFAEALKHSTAPKRLVRDDKGRVSHVETVTH